MHSSRVRQVESSQNPGRNLCTVFPDTSRPSFIFMTALVFQAAASEWKRMSISLSQKLHFVLNFFRVSHVSFYFDTARFLEPTLRPRYLHLELIISVHPCSNLYFHVILPFYNYVECLEMSLRFEA